MSATPDELTGPHGLNLRQAKPRAVRAIAFAGLTGAACITLYVTVLRAPDPAAPSAVAPVAIERVAPGTQGLDNKQIRLVPAGAASGVQELQ